MKVILPLVFVPAFALTACGQMGADVVPVLDGPAQAGYAQDLDQCRALARAQKHLDQDTMASAVIGAGIGAALGAVDESGSLEGGLAIGLLTGGAQGLSDAALKREAIVLDCLRGRGHNVVG